MNGWKPGLYKSNLGRYADESDAGIQKTAGGWRTDNRDAFLAACNGMMILLNIIISRNKNLQSESILINRMINYSCLLNQGRL
jgi:hypothetical protein